MLYIKTKIVAFLSVITCAIFAPADDRVFEFNICSFDNAAKKGMTHAVFNCNFRNVEFNRTANTDSEADENSNTVYDIPSSEEEYWSDSGTPPLHYSRHVKETKFGAWVKKGKPKLPKLTIDKKYSYDEWKKKIVNYIFSKGKKKKDGEPAKNGLKKSQILLHYIQKSSEAYFVDYSIEGPRSLGNDDPYELAPYVEAGKELIDSLPKGIKFHDSVQEFNDSEIDKTFQIQGHKPKSETGRAARKSGLNKNNLYLFLSKTFSITSEDLCFEINMRRFARQYRPEAALRCFQTFKTLLLDSTYHMNQRAFQECTMDLGNSITLRSFTKHNYRIINMQKNDQDLVRMKYIKDLNPNLPEMQVGLEDIDKPSPVNDLFRIMARLV